MTTAEPLSKTSAEHASVRAERDRILRAYEQLKGQLDLLRRRLFLAKAERVATHQLEIEFAETQAKLGQLAKEIDSEAANEDGAASDDSGAGPPSATGGDP